MENSAYRPQIVYFDTDLLYGNQAMYEDEVNRFHFDYIRPDEQTQKYIENIRKDYKQILGKLHSIAPSRERSLAITKLEEALVFATKAVVVDFKGRETALEMDVHNAKLKVQNNDH